MTEQSPKFPVAHTHTESGAGRQRGTSFDSGPIQTSSAAVVTRVAPGPVPAVDASSPAAVRVRTRSVDAARAVRRLVGLEGGREGVEVLRAEVEHVGRLVDEQVLQQVGQQSAQVRVVRHVGGVLRQQLLLHAANVDVNRARQ